MYQLWRELDSGCTQGSDDCVECGGGAMERACIVYGGHCGRILNVRL